MKTVRIILELVRFVLLVASLGVALFMFISAVLFVLTDNSVYAGWALISSIFAIPAACFVANQ